VVILAPDLLEKFHLPRLPSQPASTLDRKAQNRMAVYVFMRGAKSEYRSGPIQSSEIK
jgi:hypothetical protein